MSVNPDKLNRFEETWEGMGVELVTQKLANGTLAGGPQYREEAQKWLKRKRQEAESRRLAERDEDKAERGQVWKDGRIRWWIALAVSVLTFVAGVLLGKTG